MDETTIGWKKIYSRDGVFIIKLEIPSDAKKIINESGKCRCDKAKVLDIQNMRGDSLKITRVLNTNFKDLLYEVGKMVYPDSFDEDETKECSHGIHYYTRREKALKYYDGLRCALVEDSYIVPTPLGIGISYPDHFEWVREAKL